MDVALWQVRSLHHASSLTSLNPCCNGCSSLTLFNDWFVMINNVLILVVMDVALWPRDKADATEQCGVLILVVMDVALWQLGELTPSQIAEQVLILVVMDVALWPYVLVQEYLRKDSLNPCCNGCSSLTCGYCSLFLSFNHCLNPCCNGCSSLTPEATETNTMSFTVLILVVMDVALWLNLS